MMERTRQGFIHNAALEARRNPFNKDIITVTLGTFRTQNNVYSIFQLKFGAVVTQRQRIAEILQRNRATSILFGVLRKHM